MTQEQNGARIKQSEEDHFVLNYLMITVMLVSFTMVIVNAVRAAVPGWNGNLLIFFTVLITLESLVSYRKIRQSTIFDSNPFITRLTEWIVILIGIKVISYLLTSPDQLIVDINTWRQDFSQFFLQGEYLIICIYMLIIWGFAGGFASNLDKLGDDVELLELERQGYARTNRTDSRRGLMALIFGLGSVMIFMTTVTQINLPFYQFSQNPIFFDVGLIMLFFVSGFVLLARSQLVILQARWYIENVPANPKVGSRWMLYAVILVFSIALVVIFLPTSYSLGLLDILRYVVQILLYIFTFLQLILFTPLIALFSLLARLLGKGETPSAQATLPPVVVPTPSPSQAAAPNNFLDLIKSIIFWAIFLFVVIYAFRHYVINHRGLALGFQRLFGWINFPRAWEWLKRQFFSLNRQLTSVVDNSVSRIRSFISRNSISLDPIGSLSRLLPARQRIMLIYVTMIQWNQRNGIDRKVNQTPNEYAQVLGNTLPDHIADIDEITRTFIEARYTRHPISVQQAASIQQAVDRIQAAIRTNLEQNQQLERQV